MHHFFVSPQDIKGDKVIIRGDDVKHITRSLRLGSGDEITTADGEGSTYLIEIIRTADKVVEGKIKEKLEREVEPPLEVTLVQGLPKRKKKMDLIVQKCTELGVTEIIPIITERTVVKLSPSKAKRRQERWQKIAEEAGKQSKRAKIPTVGEVRDYEEALSEVADYDLAVIPWEEERSKTWKQVVGSRSPGGIVIFIGPEGGFTEEEAVKARETEVIPVSLGPRILRTETAGIAAVTMALYELGDLGG